MKLLFIKTVVLLTLIVTTLGFNICFFKMIRDIKKIDPLNERIFLGAFLIWYWHSRLLPDCVGIRLLSVFLIITSFILFIVFDRLNS
jgi:hypothetical protein